MIRADRPASGELLRAASCVSPVQFVDGSAYSPVQTAALSGLKALIVRCLADPPVQGATTSIHAINVITGFGREICRVVATPQQLRNWSQIFFKFPCLLDGRLAVANHYFDFRLRAIRAHTNVTIAATDTVQGPEVTALVRGHADNSDFRPPLHDSSLFASSTLNPLFSITEIVKKSARRSPKDASSRSDFFASSIIDYRKDMCLAARRFPVFSRKLWIADVLKIVVESS